MVQRVNQSLKIQKLIQTTSYELLNPKAWTLEPFTSNPKPFEIRNKTKPHTS